MKSGFTRNENISKYQVGNLIEYDENIVFAKKKLAVLVPFRDCFEEMLVFAPNLSNFLIAQEIPHQIFLINQADGFRFNRAALVNVGFLYTKKKFDYLVMHDVDFIPLNKNLSYEFPPDSVRHILARWLHPEKRYVS